MKRLPPHSTQVSSPRYCHLPTDGKRSKRLAVACAGSERCLPSYEVERAGFPCFGIEFVAEGAGQLTLDGHSHPLHGGVMFCYGPGVRHRIVCDPAKPMTKFFVDFSGTEFWTIAGEGGLAPGGALQVLDVAGMRFLFESLINSGFVDSGLSAELCAAYLRVILLKTAEGITPLSATEPSALVDFSKWMEFIDGNFERLRDLGDIARALTVSPNRLCRIFKQCGQPGPFRYLTLRKLNRSAELLAVGGRSVKQAAAEVGYEDPYHFSRLFKNHFGLAPSHFQQSFRR